MSSYSIGLSALRVNQQLMDIAGQNIANAGNVDYHRQVAQVAARTFGRLPGDGVELTSIKQMRNGLVEAAQLRNTGDGAALTAQLDMMRQVQDALAPGDGTVNDLLGKFFNGLQQLSAQPADMAQRRVVLTTAANLADRINTLAGDLDGLKAGVDAQAGQQVAALNTLAGQVAKLNGQIQQAAAAGQEVNTLRDQRDALVTQMAGLADVRAAAQDPGQVTVVAAGVPIVVGTRSVALSYGSDGNGHAAVTLAGSPDAPPLSVSGGQLGGLLRLRNETLPDFRGRVDELAQGLVRQVNGLQATGLGLSGPLTTAAGDRAVTSPSVPLAKAGLTPPPQAGSLFVSVTDEATGRRTMTEVAIDPATQSLNDVAGALSGVGHVQAVVDPQTNTLRVLAEPGYAFDFAGRLPSAPDTTGFTGTARPQVSGPYTGSANDDYTFSVTGAGTVGVTPGLTLEVRNRAGTLLGQMNVGQGYEPGSSLTAVNGVSVSLAAGSVNAGDKFSTPVVAQPDTAGLLTGLGVNTLFSGTGPGNLGVCPELLADPKLLGGSRSGDPADGSMLARMAGVQDQRAFAGGTQTAGEFFAALVGDAGIRVQDLDQQQTAANAIGQGLAAQRASVSGVDPNEELMQLVEYQRSYQMSAKYVSVVNDTLDAILQMV